MDSPTTASKNVFNWDDPFLLDTQLEDDERMIRDAADSPFVADRGSADQWMAGAGVGYTF